ncbi:hypothetical protein ACFY94_02655 [Streptomyces griseorubiginosus]|uniref:Rv1733c family protein n=1 Tax=Streptomyces griseorubiginosus TaxID=67304 RepID=UPI0036EAF28B
MPDGSRGTKSRLWRWRSNPLRRHDDVVEAWIVLVMWTVVVVGGVIAGLVTAHAAHEVFARERAERHSVAAVLLTDVPQTPSAARGTDRALAKVSWTAEDGVTRTGQTMVGTGLHSGSTVTVWLDARGALTTEPTGPTEAAAESALFGFAAAAALSGLAFGAGALLRWELDRRRLAQWAKEWDLVGPRWNQTTG